MFIGLYTRDIIRVGRGMLKFYYKDQDVVGEYKKISTLLFPN